MSDTPLKTARETLGLSQSEMAARVGLSSKGYYSRLERGFEEPSVPVALALERMTGVDAGTLNREVALARAPVRVEGA